MGPKGTSIMKGCSENKEKLGCQSQTTGESTMTVCSCEGDFCNASPDTRTSSKVSILLFAFLANLF